MFWFGLLIGLLVGFFGALFAGLVFAYNNSYANTKRQYTSND